MSAQVSFSTEKDTHEGPRLELVPPVRSTVSSMGFAVIVMALVALGMGLVMVVTTSVAAQSKELSELRTEATQLDYRAASLTTDLQKTSSSALLAMRASELGMVPNPYPAFIRLSDKAILGEARAVTDEEAPGLRVRQKDAGTSPQVRTSPTEQVLPAAPGADR